MHNVAGPTIEGILLGRSSGHYVLTVAKLKKDEEQTFSLDGTIKIPREKIAFYQELD